MVPLKYADVEMINTQMSINLLTKEDVDDDSVSIDSSSEDDEHATTTRCPLMLLPFREK